MVGAAGRAPSRSTLLAASIAPPAPDLAAVRRKRSDSGEAGASSTAEGRLERLRALAVRSAAHRPLTQRSVGLARDRTPARPTMRLNSPATASCPTDTRIYLGARAGHGVFLAGARARRRRSRRRPRRPREWRRRRRPRHQTCLARHRWRAARADADGACRPRRPRRPRSPRAASPPAPAPGARARAPCPWGRGGKAITEAWKRGLWRGASAAPLAVAPRRASPRKGTRASLVCGSRGANRSVPSVYPPPRATCVWGFRARSAGRERATSVFPCRTSRGLTIFAWLGRSRRAPAFRSSSPIHDGLRRTAAAATTPPPRRDNDARVPEPQLGRGREQPRLVRTFKDKLEGNGAVCWFDEVRLTGHIDAKVTAGIDESCLFLQGVE